MLETTKQLQNLAISAQKTISTVESCTGGMIAETITNIAGASKYFIGGVVAYSNYLKINLVNVKSLDLQKYGAVSEIVAQQMALGGLQRLHSDICLSVTGIAGPDGGSFDKPIGTVWFGIATKTYDVAEDVVQAIMYNFSGNRQQIRQAACKKALEMLIENIRHLA